jgi:hypothetical protein
METSGLDPEITICKIAVLPVKLCPLIIIYNITYNIIYLYTFILFKHFTILK